MAIIMTAQGTMDAVQEWANSNDLEYDTIQVSAHDCNNSQSGIIFTAWAREAKVETGEDNALLPDVSQRSELLNAFIAAYNAQPKHKRSDTLSVMDAQNFLKGIL